MGDNAVSTAPNAALSFASDRCARVVVSSAMRCTAVTQWMVSSLEAPASETAATTSAAVFADASCFWTRAALCAVNAAHTVLTRRCTRADGDLIRGEGETAPAAVCIGGLMFAAQAEVDHMARHNAQQHAPG